LILTTHRGCGVVVVMCKLLFYSVSSAQTCENTFKLHSGGYHGYILEYCVQCAQTFENA
jgi:hypothetical protein